MNDDPDRNGYGIREVPFDEWADVDTLVHRAGITSGDFDYTLHPLCPDCGNDLALEYEQLADGGSILAVLACDSCRVVWTLQPDDQGDGATTTGR